MRDRQLRKQFETLDLINKMPRHSPTLRTRFLDWLYGIKRNNNGEACA